MPAAISGGAVISRALSRYGIRTVFAVAGASHSWLLDALAKSGFEIISSRHESGCVSAADGYARVTGRLGVALIIADQGMPNAINGIAAAFHACSAVLVLVARLPDSWTESEAESDNLQHRLIGSITKWARTVPSETRLVEYVDAAAKRALSGRRGPVVLQIPQEFLQARCDSIDLPPPPVSLVRGPVPDPIAIETAARALVTAQRPLLIVGAGACYGDAGDALRALVAEHEIPVAGNGLGRGLVPEDGQRSFSWPYMQIAACEADVVCVIGARLKQRLGFGLAPRFASDAIFIQVDVIAEELSRNRPIDIPIVADAGAASRALLEAMRAADTRPAAGRGYWLHDRLQARRDYLSSLESATSEVSPVHPLALGNTLARHVTSDTIVVGDGADIQNWMYASLPVRQSPGFLDHYPLGAMGVGTPLAIGAAAAAKEMAKASGVTRRKVVLVTGDGSFGFYPAEWHAAARADLDITCFIGNDGAWGTEWHGQQQALGVTVNTELGRLPYELVAQGFGCRGLRIDNATELEATVRTALNHTGPCVVNVMIDRDSGHALKTVKLARMILFDDLTAGKVRA